RGSRLGPSRIHSSWKPNRANDSLASRRWASWARPVLARHGIPDSIGDYPMITPRVEPLVALLRAVARLALPCEEQIAYVRRLGGSLDELALEFNEGAALLDQFVAQGWLSTDDAEALRKIDE